MLRGWSKKQRRKSETEVETWVIPEGNEEEEDVEEGLVVGCHLVVIVPV